MRKPPVTDVDCQVANYSRWHNLLPSCRCYSHYRVMCLVEFPLLDANGRAMSVLSLKLNLTSSVKLHIVLYATTFS